MQRMRVDALNVPLRDMGKIIERWQMLGGLGDIEIIALYFFYNDLCQKLHILCPRYSLAYSEAGRTRESIGNILWARFPNDMPQLID